MPTGWNIRWNYFASRSCKCENSTRVVFSRSPGTEIYSSFDTPLGSFTGEDGVLIPPRVEYRVEFLPPKFHPLFHSY